MLLTGIPSLERPKTISALFLISSRPANSGGRVPAPGAYGFVIGFIVAFYRKFPTVYKILIIRVTLTYIQSHQLPTGSITWMPKGLARRPLERRACGDFWVQSVACRRRLAIA